MEMTQWNVPRFGAVDAGSKGSRRDMTFTIETDRSRYPDAIVALLATTAEEYLLRGAAGRQVKVNPADPKSKTRNMTESEMRAAMTERLEAFYRGEDPRRSTGQSAIITEALDMLARAIKAKLASGGKAVTADVALDLAKGQQASNTANWQAALAKATAAAEAAKAMAAELGEGLDL